MANDNDLELAIRIEGVEKALAELQKVSGAVKTNTSEVQKNAKAVDEQAKKVTVAGVEIDKFGSTLGLAGQAVGRLNGTAGAMVSSLGAATGAIQALTTAGLGPLGIAVTAANLAITAGVALFGDHATAASNAERETKTLIDRINELATAYDNAAKQAEEWQKIVAGQGSTNQYRALQETTEQAVGGLSDRLREDTRALAELRERYGDRLAATPDDMYRIGENTEEINVARRRERALVASIEDRQGQLEHLNSQLGALQRRIDQDAPESAAQGSAATAVGAVEASGSGAAAAATRSAPRGAAASARGGLDADARRYIAGKASESAAAAAEQAAEQARIEREVANENFLRGKRDDFARAALEQQRERDAQLYEQRVQAEEKVTRLLAEEEDRRKRSAEEAAAARIESFQKAADVLAAAGNATASVYGIIDDASAKSDESEEQKQKRQLKRTAFDQSIQAIVNTAQSIAAFAGQNYPAGIGYAAAAATNIAAAVKAGGDAGNVPSGGGGAAGGAMQRDSIASRGPSSSSQPTTIVVNMNGPTIATADRAELGRQLNQLVAEGRGRYGDA